MTIRGCVKPLEGAIPGRSLPALACP